MYSNVSMVTFCVLVSGAFGSTSYCEDSARESLAATPAEWVALNGISFAPYAKYADSTSNAHRAIETFFSCALIPHDTLKDVLLTL
jgi:hypothetical protein